MFGAKIATSVTWNARSVQRNEEEMRDAFVVVNSDIRLPVDGFGPKAQLTASIGCGPQDLSYKVSGGCQDALGMVRGTVSVSLTETFRLSLAGASVVTLVFHISFDSMAQGALRPLGDRLVLVYNGQTHPFDRVGQTTKLSSTVLNGSDSVPLQLTLSDSISFGPGEAGNLTRKVAIENLEVIDAAGTLVPFRYTTASGQKYSSVMGVYGDTLALGASGNHG